MQSATSSTRRKPIQRSRFGKTPEGLSVSRGVACVERNDENLRDPFSSRRQEYGMRIFSHIRGNPDTEAIRNLKPCFYAGRPIQRKEGRPKTVRESDIPIVLRDGRAVHMGKGYTELRSLQRKHVPDMLSWRIRCQPH